LTFSRFHPKTRAARQAVWRAAGDDGGNDRYCRVQLPGVSWVTSPRDLYIGVGVVCQSSLLLRDAIIPVRYAADVLGVTPETVRNWIRSFPDVGVRIGGRYHIYESALAQIASGTPLWCVQLPSSRLDNGRSDDERASGQHEYRSEQVV